MHRWTIGEYGDLMRDVGVRDTMRLKVLHRHMAFLEENGELVSQKLRALRDQLRELEEDGKVLIVDGGRDCEGCEFWGHTRVIDATIKDYKAAVEAIYDSAEGPCWFGLARVSERHTIKSGSRDLALEAFENGHPHCLMP